MITPRDRILGCLLGGAIGDALGAPVEFESWRAIRHLFGDAGLTAYAPAHGGIGRITDDTQMTLFTAEALLRARTLDHVDLHAAYLRWLLTQSGSGTADGWLVSTRALHARRAPGTTCLGALYSGRSGTTAEPLNNSKGCGGVMRVAPVGLVARGEDAFRIGADAAAVTHGHPTGYLAAGAFAVVIGELVRGAALETAIAAARAELTRHPRHDQTLRAIDAALALAAKGEPTPYDLEMLGGAWVAEEALAISLCCALAARGVRHGLLLAVNHGGDSDSTGAITGNLLGAQLGVRALPEDLLAPLEARDVIEQVGHDLADVFVDGKPVDEWRYPPG